MSAPDELVVKLRRRILTGLHLGEFEAGDRLTSIRSLAAETGRDHRTVSAAYRTLEEEGLVEVRPRSGVYVADRSTLGEDELPSPIARWVADVLVEGLSRRIPVPELPELLEQCTRSVQLHCGVVESVGDVIDALRDEVERDLGLSTDAVAVSDRITPRDEERLEKLLDRVTVLVTTVFHAPAVRPLAEARDLPLVEVQVNADWVATFRRELEKGPIRVVVEDSGFEPRLRAAIGPDRRGGLRVVDAERAAGSLEEHAREGALFVTPSARRRLRELRGSGLPENVTVLENVPMLAHTTFRELAEILVWQNLDLGRCP